MLHETQREFERDRSANQHSFAAAIGSHIDNADDEYINIASPAIESSNINDKGEAPEIYIYTTYLLNNYETRRILYLVLISIWLLPLSIQTLDVVLKTSKLTSNSFCVNSVTCFVSFIGFTMMFIAVLIQFYLLILKNNEYGNKHLYIFSYILQYIGFLLISSIIIIVTFNIYFENTPNTKCFSLDDNTLNKYNEINLRFCRVSYFGNNILGLIVIILINLDLYVKNQHFKIRIFCMSFGVLLSSLCIISNLIINKQNYVNKDTGLPLTIGCFIVCIIGYSLCILSVILLIPLLICNNRLNWKYKRRLGKISGTILLFGLFCIQVRTYSEHWVFTLVSLILIVDIQVISEQ